MHRWKWALVALVAGALHLCVAQAAEPPSPLVPDRAPSLPSVTPEVDILERPAADGTPRVISTGDPDVAEGELTYIAGLKRGRAPEPGDITSLEPKGKQGGQ